MSMEDASEFLSRVEDAERQIKAMMEGTLNPDEVTIDGQKVADIEKEEQEAEARRQKIREAVAAKAARTDEEKREKRLKKKEEERAKWWEHAEVVFGTRETEETTTVRPRISGLDYNRWDRWAADPDDPVSVAEKEAAERKLNEERDAEFEKLNPDFCSQFKDDMKKREAMEIKRVEQATQHKNQGNTAFKARKYEDALRMYHKALKAIPFEVAYLTNIAQAHLKQGELDDAIEFANRALYVDPKSVKGLFRRAAAYRAKNDHESAVADLEKAVELEPANKDLAKELAKARMEKEEATKEAEGVDPHVLLRTSGRFEDVCTRVRDALGSPTTEDEASVKTLADGAAGAAGAGAGAGASGDDDGTPLITPTDQRRALLTLADACSNPKNRDLLSSSGTFSCVLSACCSATSDALHASAFSAALALVEVVASHREKAHLVTIARTPRFLECLLRQTEVYINDPRLDVEATEAVAHACSILQTIASWADGEKHPTIEKAIGKLERPVERLLLLASAIVARSSFSPQLLTSLMMTAVVGALANLAQREDLRPPFAARPPGLDGTASSGHVCRVLLDLQRLPLPSSPQWDSVCGSALAALCNSCLGQPEVLAAVQRSDGVSVVLSMMERDPPLSDVVLARASSLLARLSQDSTALTELASPDVFKRLVALFGRDSVGTGDLPMGLEDGLIRAIAATLKEGSVHIVGFIQAGGIEAAARVYASSIAGSPAAPAPLERLPALGNLTAAMIKVAGPTQEKLQARLLAAELPASLVELMKRAPDGPIRKNAAVALARMARHTPSRDRIRELRGLEIMIQLGRSLG